MSAGELFSLLGPIILLLGILYGALVFVKKFSFNVKGKQVQNLNLNIISNQMIVPKKYISLVRVEDKILILGISEQSINLLKEIDYHEDVTENDTLSGEESGFWTILKNKMSNQ